MISRCTFIGAPKEPSAASAFTAGAAKGQAGWVLQPKNLNFLVCILTKEAN